MIFLITVCLMSHLKCPKCSGFSWIAVEPPHVIQKCICGLTDVLEVSRDGMDIQKAPRGVTQYTLPGRGTQLSKVLGCLVRFPELDSAQIAGHLGISVDKATTNLSVLRSRGLIRTIINRKGKAGGSFWQLTPDVKKYYGD